MKAYYSTKIQHLIRLAFVIMFVLSSMMIKAQSPDDSGSIRLEIKDDTCNRGEGEAHLIISAMYQSQMIIVWAYTDNVTGELRTDYNVLSIENLHRGIVSVTVKSTYCDNIIFESIREVGNDANGLSATIEVTTNTTHCDEKASAELVVVQNGGMGVSGISYHYDWGGDGGDINHITVTESRVYKCKVWDDCGECYVQAYVSLEDLKCPHDPNMIFGPEGYGDDMMVSARTKMPYTIEFENDPEFATAPASRVEIEYPIPAEQRLASFRLGDFGFGQFVFTVPSNTSSYYQRLDVSDSLGVWVDVTAGIDIIHNKAFWVFQSIDPSTGSEPQSSQLGFLLVNDDEGRGEGYVNYYISPADGLQTGDTTSAVATIVFDDNAPIGTNVWTNKFDAVAPTSTIANVDIIENDSTNCVITFSSQDDLNGSGVHSVELFVSVNGAPYLSAGSYAPESEVNYQLMNGSFYEFISIATDNVGNIEDFKTIPDATIDYGFVPSDITLSKYYFYENDLVGSVVGELNTIDVGDVFTYQLVDGEGASDNNLFAISGDKLVTNTDFNCEERLDYSVRVRSTDVSNLYVEKAFDISMVKTNQTYDFNYEGDICQGENFFGYGWNINMLDSVPGTYIYTRNLQTISGCDSIRTLTVRVHPEFLIPITDEIVYGEDYTLNGFNILNPVAGTVYDTLYLQTIHGCDSIVSLTLTVNPEGSVYTQAFSLFSGWNWWSTCIETADADVLGQLKTGLGESGQIIKSQTQSQVHIGENWFGSLDMLNERTYMVKANSQIEVDIIGPAALPENHPITLDPGWTWIGYPSNETMTASEALVNHTPQTGDVIKCQNASAMYMMGSWHGALTLTPGIGLMYKSNNSEAVTFTYATPSRMGDTEINTVETHWRANHHAYPTNMTVLAVVELDGEEINSENYELAAFAGNECRGSVNMMHVEPLDRYMALLTISGEEAAELRFALYNTETGEECFNANETLTYEADAVVGSPEAPFVIRFCNTTDLDEWANSLQIFPNPVEHGQTVSLGKTDELGMVQVEIIDALGTAVETRRATSLQTIIAPNVAGVYTLRITVEGKGTCYRKLVVR